MQSSRKPRRTFAAPLILSVAALPACIVASNKPASSTNTDPEQRDHRQPDPETTDHRQPDGDPVVISNPPRPEPYVLRQDSSYDESWQISVEADGSCKAYGPNDCPGEPKCRPAPARAVACPEGMQAGETWSLWADKGSTECFTMAVSDCPKGATCNPPPPTRASCPE